MDNRIRLVRFEEGEHVGRDVTDRPLYQGNYGQVIQFDGLTLPDSFEVHMTDESVGEAVQVIGGNNEVEIPNVLMERSGTLTVYIFLHDTEDDGTTCYTVWLMRNPKIQPDEQEIPEPEQDVISQTIGALNEAVAKAEEIRDSIPETVETALTEAKESGEFDGVSPTASVTQTEGGAIVTVTDASGETTAFLRNGAKGDKGDPGEPGKGAELHICSASEYDATTRVPTVAEPKENTFYLVPAESGASPDMFVEWIYVNNAWEMFGSAKIDLSGYALKEDTVLTTTLSRGRKSGEEVGDGSFAFGFETIASGEYSHAEGMSTNASGDSAHAEGTGGKAVGNNSHAEGLATIANGRSQHVVGEYNAVDVTPATPTERSPYAEIVGNGTADNKRSNARTLDWTLSMSC